MYDNAIGKVGYSIIEDEHDCRTARVKWTGQGGMAHRTRTEEFQSLSFNGSMRWKLRLIFLHCMTHDEVLEGKSFRTCKCTFSSSSNLLIGQHHTCHGSR